MEKDGLEELFEINEAYEEYARWCKMALRITLARIKNIQEDMKYTEDRSPFDTIISRIKTFESVSEKCSRKGYDLTISSIKENVKDIAGIRIITTFRDDIYTVAELIEKTPGINIIDKKDYVKEPKENGYSSLHLHAQVEIYLSTGSKLVPVEIQIRDKAMDMWATIEHIVSYKSYENQFPETLKSFRDISKVLDKFDKMAISLRDHQTKNPAT